MNLLNDQREKGGPPAVHDFFQEQPQAEDKPGAAPEESFTESIDGAVEYKKPKFTAPFLITLAIVIVGLVATYFLFFRPARDSGQYTLTPTVPEAVVDDSTSGIKPGAEGGEETPEVSVGEAVPVPVRDRGANIKTSDVLTTFMKALPEGVHLGTLYLDERSFTAEVNAANRAEIVAFQEQLQEQISKEIRLSGTGVNALITGSFLATGNGSVVQPADIDRGALGPALSALAGEMGLDVVDLKIGEDKILGTTRAAEVFVKLKGSISDCQSYFEQIAQKGWNLKLSKMILMPSAGQEASIVLRFQFVNPV